MLVCAQQLPEAGRARLRLGSVRHPAAGQAEAENVLLDGRQDRLDPRVAVKHSPHFFCFLLLFVIAIFCFVVGLVLVLVLVLFVCLFVCFFVFLFFCFLFLTR